MNQLKSSQAVEQVQDLVFDNLPNPVERAKLVVNKTYEMTVSSIDLIQGEPKPYLMITLTLGEQSFKRTVWFWTWEKGSDKSHLIPSRDFDKVLEPYARTKTSLVEFQARVKSLILAEQYDAMLKSICSVYLGKTVKIRTSPKSDSSLLNFNFEKLL